MRAQYKAADSVADNNVWYDSFADITFETSFASFSKEQGLAFIVYYRNRHCSGNTPSAEDDKILQSLQDTIDNMMSSQHFAKSSCDAFFVRLNTRSPKDAIAINQEEFIQEVQKQKLNINDQFRLFFDLSMESLCVHSGKEAVELMLSSERIFVDILQAFDADEQNVKNPESGYKWDLEICVRKWESSLREELEFRGFVSNYELIGLSQYNTYVCYPQVIANKVIIESLIQSFYEKSVKPRLQKLDMPFAVVDIALLPEGDFTRPYRYAFRPSFTWQSLESGRVVVIELNPFNKRTGGGLFNWEDETVLDTKRENGELDFRLVLEGQDKAIATESDNQIMMFDMLLAEANSAFERRLSMMHTTTKPESTFPIKCTVS
jgi:hypothetical protein